jgi:hypothetical protein
MTFVSLLFYLQKNQYMLCVFTNITYLFNFILICLVAIHQVYNSILEYTNNREGAIFHPMKDIDIV